MPVSAVIAIEPPVRETRTPRLRLRRASTRDADALFALIGEHVAEGRLLPRTLDDLRRHADRFIVGTVGGVVQACAELAPLSDSVAEVRSLVVARPYRGVGAAGRLVGQLMARAMAHGFESVTAFTHDPRFFVRQGFSIVPRLWIPEKIAADCRTCPLCLRCEQVAMVKPLASARRFAAPGASAERHAAVA